MLRPLPLTLPRPLPLPLPPFPAAAAAVGVSPPGILLPSSGSAGVIEGGAGGAPILGAKLGAGARDGDAVWPRLRAAERAASW